MRSMAMFVAFFALLAAPVLAQTTPERAEHGQRLSSPHRRPAHAPSRDHKSKSSVDVGPFTPEANRAYQGGGVILQGEPGASAPTPEATPPGQTPRGAVAPMR